MDIAGYAVAMTSRLLLCCLAAAAVAGVDGGANNKETEATHEVRLIKEVLKSAQEHAHYLARPVKDGSHKVKVKFGLSLVQVLDMDEKNQVITITVWKHYKWRDEFQTWNSSDYGNTKRVILPSHIIWTPDIVLYDNVEKRDIEYHKEKLTLWSNGDVEWAPYVVYRSACAVDMHNFPFDVQTCSFKFGSWSYSEEEVDLEFLDNEEDFRKDQLLDNVEWTLTGTSAVRNEVSYTCCPAGKYVDLTYSLVLKRNYGFFFKFMLLPTLLLSCLILVIFWIPPTRPDRTGLGTSLMGSFMLLLILVTNISPPSEVIKFVSYICANMVLVGLATLFSSAMINLSMRSIPMPAATKHVLLDTLGWLLCVTVRPKKPKENGGPETAAGPSEGGNNLLSKQEAPVNHQQQWQQLVKVLDRLFFLIFLVVVIICVFLFFPLPK